MDLEKTEALAKLSQREATLFLVGWLFEGRKERRL